MIVTEVHCLLTEHWCVFDYFHFPFRRVAWRSGPKTKHMLQLPTAYSVFEFLHPFTLRINRINREKRGYLAIGLIRVIATDWIALGQRLGFTNSSLTISFACSRLPADTLISKVTMQSQNCCLLGIKYTLRISLINRKNGAMFYHIPYKYIVRKNSMIRQSVLGHFPVQFRIDLAVCLYGTCRKALQRSQR